MLTSFAVCQIDSVCLLACMHPCIHMLWVCDIPVSTSIRCCCCWCFDIQQSRSKRIKYLSLIQLLPCMRVPSYQIAQNRYHPNENIGLMDAIPFIEPVCVLCSWYCMCWHLIFILLYFTLFLFPFYFLAFFVWFGLFVLLRFETTQWKICSGRLYVCLAEHMLVLPWYLSGFHVETQSLDSNCLVSTT